MKKLNINGDQIAVRVGSGEGTPIVLVHGNSASSQAYQKQFEGKLNERYHLIAIDLPGHGDSDKASDVSTYSLPGYAKVVAAVARELNASNGVFVGWSLGGHVLLEGVDELNEAAGFVIFGTPPVGKPPVMADAFHAHPTNEVLYSPTLTDEQTQTFADSFFKPGVSSPSKFVEDIRNTDPQARPNLGGSVVAGNFRDEIEVVTNLKQPIAIFHGAQEQLVRGDYFQKLNIPTLWRGQVQMIENAGHAPQWEQPEKFDELLAAFVEDARR